MARPGLPCKQSRKPIILCLAVLLAVEEDLQRYIIAQHLVSSSFRTDPAAAEKRTNGLNLSAGQKNQLLKLRP